MSDTPLFWLKRIESALELRKEIPLWGSSPPFPWKRCSQELATLFQIPALQIELKGVQFLTGEQLRGGLGEHPLETTLALTPLTEPLHFLIAEEDAGKLAQMMLSSQPGIKGFSSAHFREGFYRYLSVHVVQALDELKVFQDLSLRLAPSEPLPAEGGLCVDVALKTTQHTLWGRLVCSDSFLQAFKAHFGTQRPSLLSSPLIREIDLELAFEVGHTGLPLAEWKEVRVGDCVVLDRCSYDPETHKGTVTVTLAGAPLFRARLKENGLKIVDYAFYYEEEKTMDTDPPEEDKEAELPPEEEGLENSENHLWSNEQEAVEKVVETREIPVTVTVEVARLKMNLEKLLQMKTGNLIELPVRPEQGVDLLINGKRVATGELVKLGEALGVKILHIGN